VAASIVTCFELCCCRERASSSTSSSCLDNRNRVELPQLLLLLGPHSWHLLLLLLLLSWLRPCINNQLVYQPPCGANPTPPCLSELSL
jgi:hypothetical protein